MRLDNTVNQIFTAAFNEAKERNHEYLTPEHVLYAALFFDEGAGIISGCGGNVDALKWELENFFSEHLEEVESKEIIESVTLQNVIHYTQRHVISSGKEIIHVGDIIISIYDEEQSFAAYFIKKQGIQRLDILKYITHGVSIYNGQEAEYEEYDEEDEESGEYSEEDGFYEGEDVDQYKREKLLKNFTIELTEKARRGEIDPLIGREDILRRTLQVLSRRLKNNPIHVGEPGVGKTAITEGLAKLIVEGKVPDVLSESKIYYLDMGALLAGTKYRGDFEERIKRLLGAIGKEKNAIVYIDEIHTVVGAGAVSGGAMDASNILKPFLTNGKLRFIGSTTYEEYKKYFEKDRALSRRFQKIEVEEPSVEDTIEILKGLKEKYEEFHNVRYSESTLRLAAELSAKYINDRHLPDKAIDVIDETGALARLNETSKQKGKVIKITEGDIERTVSFIAKIPEQSVSGNEITKLQSLGELIKKEIYGQDQAVDALVRAIKRSRAGFNDDGKPVASLLFVGPTGVGKTEVTKQLSSIMGIQLVRFDMSEYQEKHTVARLIGAPPGYVGYEEGGLLTDAIRKSPYCVLLLDEIEKAHSDIYNVLLQVMDYATLTDNNGKKADFRNVIIIMTSNAGAREITRTMLGFSESRVGEGAVSREVERVFSPEFRNRLDEIIVFKGMDEDMAVLVAKKAMKKFEDKLASKNIKLKVTDECYRWLADKGRASSYGAREIMRIVQEKVKTYFVDEVLFGELANGGTAVVDVKDDKVSIKREE